MTLASEDGALDTVVDSVVVESVDWVELGESVCTDEASNAGDVLDSVAEDELESGPEGRDVLDSDGGTDPEVNDPSGIGPLDSESTGETVPAPESTEGDDVPGIFSDSNGEEVDSETESTVDDGVSETDGAAELLPDGEAVLDVACV